MGTWVQPKLTSDTSYGTVSCLVTKQQTGESGAAILPAYYAVDGDTATWWQLGRPINTGSTSTPLQAGWWNWKLPETIKIKGISILNRTTARPNITVQCYTDSTKSTQIGSAVTATALNTTLVVPNIPTSGIDTDNIYFYCTSTEPWLGITEITIDADVLPTSISEFGNTDISHMVSGWYTGECDASRNIAQLEIGPGDTFCTVLRAQRVNSDTTRNAISAMAGNIDVTYRVSVGAVAETGNTDVFRAVSAKAFGQADTARTSMTVESGYADIMQSRGISGQGNADTASAAQVMLARNTDASIDARLRAMSNTDTMMSVTTVGHYAVDLDVSRNVVADQMGNTDSTLTIKKIPWRYINPGYAELLDLAGGVTVNDAVANPDNGVAFYHTSRANMFTVPAVKKLYIKLDFYMKSGMIFRVYNVSSKGTTGFRTDGNKSILAWVNDSQTSTLTTPSMLGLHTVMVAITSDATVGTLTIWLDGAQRYTYTGNVANGENLTSNYVQCDSANTLISNLIISDEPIALSERVKVLPVASSTGWTANADGTYSADTVGAELLQAPDTSGLQDVGITGVAVNLVGASCEGDINGITTEVVTGGSTMAVTTKAVTTGTWTPAMTRRPDTGGIWKPADLATTQLGVKAVKI